ncbi:hypothetical protein [Terrimonas ferruginea]|uniref:hypothetical protein n=1 Tax=Terrimonas ferruginea TaxID=249 RepID=UPI00040AA8CD|nr:hypothetical protein [Terrimonas ferruginea]
MKQLLSIFLLTISFQLSAQSKLTADQLKYLPGTWKGNLTYLDYSSGQPYTMQADLFVTLLENGRKYIFSNRYPGEPAANAADTIAIDLASNFFDGHKISYVSTIAGNGVEFATEHNGTDGNDNKPALIRLTYRFDRRMFTRKKEVQFTGTTEWLKRHEYVYWRGDKKMMSGN